MENSDKPFQCPKCELCFANSDRLAVHLLVHLKQPLKQRLRVKIPGSASENVDDQTPTPSSFLKTADVNGSPLFQDLNPFDRDFKLASNSRQTSVVEQHPEVGSTTGASKHQISILETPQVELEDAGFPKLFSQPSVVSQESGKPVSVITSSIDDTSSSASSSSSAKHVSNNEQNSTAFLQSILNQLKAQAKQEQEEKEAQEREILQLQREQQAHTKMEVELECAESSDSQQSNKESVAQEQLREQLNSLIKSGQIKIQISPSSSVQSKVQASIIGNVATISKPTEQQLSAASTVVQQQQPRTIAPKVATSQEIHQEMTSPPPPVTRSIASVGPMSVNKVTPMSVIERSILSSSTVTSDVVVLPGTNLQIAKQKLKQVIQQSPGNQALLQSLVSPAIVSSKPTMVQTAPIAHTTQMTPPSMIIGGRGSQQGKYKDIILKDEYGDEITMKRKQRINQEDSTPEEKRGRFLERNRAAASRCRQKRKIWVDQLEKRSDELVQTNTQLMTEIQSLRSEVAQLKALLLAHKDCPVTQQQKALVNQIANAGTYVTVSDGQLIAIHQLPPSAIREASDEEVASSALTDMAARATIELGKKAVSGVVTVQANDTVETKMS